MVPIRSLQTMQAEDFVTYMGSPICDLLVEVMQGEELEKRNEELSNVLSEEIENGHIQNATVLRRVRLQAFNNADELVGVHVDTGSSAGKGIVYISGTNPSVENHIALSYLLADELGKEVGDKVNIISDNQTYCMEVCGIYQDVTSGGKTAKAIYDFEGELSEKYTYQLELSNDVSAEVFSNSLKSELGSGYSIKSMDSFLEQTLGGVTVRFSQAVYLIIIIGIIITIFIVLLYMELRLARTMHALAEKIAMGIPIKAICIQELYPMLLLGGTGIILGVILTEILGETVVSALFSLLGLGITSISFSDITISCILVPVCLVIILVVINLGVCMKVKKIDITGTPVLFCTILLVIGLLTYTVFTFMDKKLDAQMGASAEEEAEEQFKVSDIGILFTSKTFLIVAGLCVLYYSAIFPFQKFATGMLEANLQMPTEEAAGLFSWFPIGAMFLTPFLGAFLDKKGKGASMLVLGSILMITCHLVFALVPLTKPIAYAAIILLGVSFSLVPAALWPSVPKLVEERYLGSAYSVIFWIQNIGLMAFPIIIGWSLDKTGGYTVPMLIFSSLGVAALLLGLWLKVEDKKKGYGLELPNIK